MQRFEVEYHLTGHGWADCDVRIGKSAVKLTASYLSDALGQLAAAALLLRMGAPSARISFVEEPGSNRWGFDWHRSPNGDVTSLRIRIWSFPNLWAYQPDDDGKIVLDEIVDQAVVYRGVRQLLDQVLAEYGEDRYEQQWGQKFPLLVRAALDSLLDQWPGRAP
jgi:hypothetical protein